jgi:hypothetical protein
MYAVTIEPLRGVYFLETLPDSVRSMASKDKRWKVQEVLKLDLPKDYDTWPEGEDCPEQVLCTSVSDPTHYKMFKYQRDIDLTNFKPTGKHFAGAYSSSSWERFMKNLPARLALEEVPDTEPPGATEEAVAAIKRRG